MPRHGGQSSISRTREILGFAEQARIESAGSPNNAVDRFLERLKNRFGERALQGAFLTFRLEAALELHAHTRADKRPSIALTTSRDRFITDMIIRLRELQPLGSSASDSDILRDRAFT